MALSIKNLTGPQKVAILLLQLGAERAAPVLRGGCQPTSPGDAVITRRDPVLPADMVERLRFGHAE